MDVFAVTKIAADVAQNIGRKAHFVNGENVQEQKTSSVKVSDILSFVLGLVIGLLAAYLSWQCNSKLSYNTFLKVIFSIFAYLFGFVYLVLYVIMRWDTCKRL